MRSKQKVWIAVYNDYDYAQIKGVFDNEKAANVYAELHYCDVEEHEISSDVPEHESFFHSVYTLEQDEPKITERYREKGSTKEPPYMSKKDHVSFEQLGIRVPYRINAWGHGDKQAFLNELEKDITFAKLVWIQLGVNPKEWRSTLASDVQQPKEPLIKFDIADI